MRSAELAAERDALQFAHVESDDLENVFYTRIQGPVTLIEIDNTEDGDHVHAVWPSSAGDFGDDLLARRWRSEHAYAGLVTGAAGK